VVRFSDFSRLIHLRYRPVLPRLSDRPVPQGMPSIAERT